MEERGAPLLVPEERGVLAHAFALWGAPAAWLVELNVGYSLATNHCTAVRHGAPPLGAGGSAVVVLLVICTAVALAALLRARRGLLQARAGPVAIGSSRRRFLALWGVALGIGFSVATVATAVGILLLSRCGG